MKKEDFFRFLFRKINRIFPKKKNQVIFESTPDFADNANSLYKYMHENYEIREKYILIWLVSDKKYLKKLKQQNIVAYEKLSLQGLYALLRSKFIFVTHNSFITLKSKNQILINLWHGMPLKSMIFTDNSESSYNLLKLKKSIDRVDIFIATSMVTKIALSSSFYTNPRKIYITGQPRNDKIFDPNSKRNLSDLLNLDLSQYEKIILYCPTFRKWGSKTNGLSKKFNLFNLEEFDESIFNQFLSKNKLLFLMKFHPFEEEYFLSQFDKNNSANLVLITNKMLQNSFFDLYDILGAVDILITDYSSIYFDFLLKQKPIIFTPTDIEHYKKNRGILLEPYDYWTPGPKTINFKEFMDEIKKCTKDQYYFENERKMVNEIVNKYKDDKSCERVYNLVFEGNNL